MKVWDYILVGIIALWLIAAFIYIIKRKKHGCNCSCGNCPYAENCKKKQ